MMNLNLESMQLVSLSNEICVRYRSKFIFSLQKITTTTTAKNHNTTKKPVVIVGFQSKAQKL